MREGEGVRKIVRLGVLCSTTEDSPELSSKRKVPSQKDHHTVRCECSLRTEHTWNTPCVLCTLTSALPELR